MLILKMHFRKSGVTVVLDNQKLNLTFSEFKLLELLASKPGRKVNRNLQIKGRINFKEFFYTKT